MIDPGAETLAWMDRWWDPGTGLLWNMPGSFDGSPARSFHCVVQSAWYAYGLLGRADAGDEERAVTTLEALLATQYDDPGTPWHGTFARFAETPHPQPGAVVWVDYDPNWRQFVGTTLQLLLDDPDRDAALDSSLRTRIDAAVELAVAGEPPGRVWPAYSNIALMHAWLAAARGRDDAEAFGAEVVAVFDEHGAFHEYNSPTYYGVDLYALGLWARHAPSPWFREAGERVEAALWRDIARWYHPGLGNLCGPFTRAYGMDMHDYAAMLGLWMTPVLGAGAPFPSSTTEYDHSHDTCMGPMVGGVGVSVPDDALAGLRSFTGEHVVEQQISSTPSRRATGWLADRVMCGGEDGDFGMHSRDQFHPATVHWLRPDGSVGWMRVVHRAAAHAVASPGELRVTCETHRTHGSLAPELWIRGIRSIDDLHGRRWRLDGLDVEVAAEPDSVTAGSDGITRVTFAVGTTDLTLSLSPRD